MLTQNFTVRHVGGVPSAATTLNSSVICMPDANMPTFCLMIGYSNDKKSCPNLSFCCVPAIIKNEGEDAEILSAKRRRLWLAAISRDDLTNRENRKTDRVCGRHFVFGKSAKPWGRFNEDWVPSLQLRHEKSKKSEKSQKEATERAQRIVDRRKHEKQELEECSVKEKIKRLADLADDRESVRHTSQEFGRLNSESVSAGDTNLNDMEIEDIEEVPQQLIGKHCNID